MLEAVPKHWFSWDFIVTDGADAVGEVNVSSWREKGTLTAHGVHYRVYREGLVAGDFVMASHDSILARATKPSALRRAFIIEHAGREYTLRATSAFRRSFELLDAGKPVGRLSPRGILTRRAAVDLPGATPLPLTLFIVWLVVILWKRESDSAAAPAAGS